MQTNDVKIILSEINNILSRIGNHKNIVNLLGAVTQDKDLKPMMILEFCVNGSIHSFVQKNRSKFQDNLNFKQEIQESSGYCVMPAGFTRKNDNESTSTDCLKTSDLLSWCYQCSLGMEFLSSQKIIHGDLAARNVLLCEDNVVKISDFGLSKSLYSYYQIKRNDQLKLPYKWLAIECFTDNIYSTKSDVWSFGVFMWELFSLCQQPYPGFLSPRDLFKELLEGYRMEKPTYSNDEVYKIMNRCWEEEPSVRPTFTELKETLKCIEQ